MTVNVPGNEWRRNEGVERSLWEPVRLADFDGKRLEALRALRQRLRDAPTASLDDQQLAMHAILETLFQQTRTTVAVAKAETLRLATLRLPKPERGRRKRLTQEYHDTLVLVVGQVWTEFTAPNFPLPPEPKQPSED